MSGFPGDDVLKSNAETVKQRAEKAKQQREEEANWNFEQQRMRAVVDQSNRDEHRRVRILAAGNSTRTVDKQHGVP